MTRRGWTWLTAAVTALVIGLVLWLQTGPPAREVPERVLDPRGALYDQGGDAETAEVSTGEPPEDADESLGEEPPVGSPTRREWLERAIRIAREERLAGGDPAGGATGGATGRTAPGGGATEEVGTLDPEYIRAAIQELKPLLAECYELAREERADLEGRLVVEFELVGEPEVGGIVDRSAIDDSSELRHPVLDECIRETIYTAELPAPEGGGRVTVRYPFDFSSE